MTSPSTESLKARIRRLEQELDDIKSSRSWRWTQFLRLWAYRLRSWLDRGARPAPAPPETTEPAAPFPDGVPTDSPAPATPPSTSGALADTKASFTRMADALLEEFLASGARLHLETSETPVVSILLVVWNRAELTLQCLRSIMPQEAPCELIVVDNGSSDRTPDLFDKVEGVRCVRNDRNRYFVPAINQAAALARGEYLLLLNNDTILLPGALNAALETARSTPGIGAVGGKIVLLDGALQEAGDIVWKDGSSAGYGRGDDPLAPPYMFRRDVDYCSGAFLLTGRDLFQQMNGLDEIFLPVYYEETDYCMRLWEAGYRVVYEPRSVLLHYEFGSSTPENAAEKQARNRKVFAERHRERLSRHSEPGPAHVLESRSADRTRRRVLVVDDRVPHPYLGSGFPRANRIVERLAGWGFAVTFYPLAVVSEDWEDVYRDIPREVEVMLERGEAGLGPFLRERQGFYDTVLVSRPHNMAKLRQVTDSNPDLLAGAEVVYDAEALFAFREARQLQLKGLAEDGELEKRLQAEVALAEVAGSVVSVSDREAREFRIRGIRKVHVLGHAYELEATAPGFADRSGFLFVGAVHATDTPNGDAILWFVREILPRIRECDPAAYLTVVGMIHSPEVAALASDSVRILGPSGDLRPYYEQSRVFIAPTRFSAGVPLKVTEAAAQGVPVVATSLLAEQLAWNDGHELLVADTPDFFAAQCMKMHGDPDEWNRVRANALRRVREEYSADRFDKTLRALIDSSNHRSAAQG